MLHAQLKDILIHIYIHVCVCVCVCVCVIKSSFNWSIENLVNNFTLLSEGVDKNIFYINGFEITLH